MTDLNSIQEILDFAIGEEEKAAEFYRQLAVVMDKEWMKETLLGVLNGAVVGLVAAAAMIAYAIFSGAEQPVVLGLVVFLAMTGACVASGMTGVLVPLTLQRLGADPATASSIFLTTATDVVSMGLFLWLANMLVL